MKSLLAGALVAFGLLVVLAMSATSLGAAPPALPPRPTVITQVPGPGERKPQGGWIELHARVPHPAEIECVVQWQDELGAWHDVDSWRGRFDEIREGIGYKTWWLDEWLFGKPNFRWVVYEGATGRVLGTSVVFAMPTENRHTVLVDVAVP